MSKNIDQVFVANPITSNASTDLMYFGQSPYGPGNDAAMTYANFSAQFGTPYTPAALTSGNDTNVTLTLGGTPTTALLHAASITAGWTGQLSLARGGTNANLTASNGGIFYSTASAGAILSGTATANLPLLSGSSAAPTWGSFALSLGGALTTAGSLTLSGAFGATFTFTNTTSVTFPTSGTLSTTSQLPTPAALTSGNDTNVTLTLGGTPATALLQASSITAGWTGTLAGSRGGLGAAITANNGGIYYSNATNGVLLSGTATAQQLLMSGASTAPQWSTSTYPLTNAINTLLYASSANTMAALATANSGVLVTSSTGVPSILAAGSTGQVLQASSAGTPSWSTPTYPSASGTARKILVSDGTNNIYSTETYAVPGTSGNVLTSDGTNWTSAAPVVSTILTTKGDILGYTTTEARVPVGTTNGQVLQVASGASAGIAYSTPTYPSASGGAGTILRSDGTNNLYTTTTYPNTNAINTIMYASSANVLGVISAANSGVLVSSSTGVPSMLAAGTTGQVLQASSAGTPSWSTPTYPSASGSAGVLLRSDGTNYVATTSTYPNTNAISTLLYASAANVMSALATANSGVLVTSSTGVPSILAAGTTGQVLQASSAGTPAWSTPTYPTASGSAGVLLRSDGTNYVATSSTYPNTNAINTLLYASASNVMSALATANSGVLVTSSTGVPSILAAGTTGQMLQASTSGTPAWSTTTYPATNAINTLLYASSANVMSALATANSSGLLTNGSGVPAWVTVTGTGAPVLATSPTLVTPTLGAATATSLTFNPTTGGIVGTTTNDNVTAGDVGEYISSSILLGSAVSLVSSTAKTITSISLTAGDWDISASFITNPAASTTSTSVGMGISTVTNTFGTVGAENNFAEVNGTFGANVIQALSNGRMRLSLSTTTTVYLIGYATFAVSTMSGYGFIGARRVR
jgi:hypothetical protein